MIETPPFIIRQEIETLIGTKINSTELYQRAFTHKSALKRYNLEHSFELLEFIGDSVLNFVITRYLFDKFSDRDEGFLTKLRTRLVRGKTLSDVGRRLELYRYVIMDEKGDRNGWANNDNILEDVFESLVGAIYNDIGLPHAKLFILRIFEDPKYIDMEKLMNVDDNYKDRLMRYCQSNSYELPFYNVIEKNGNCFVIIVMINGYQYGMGTASTKKNAEQLAAFNTLKILGLL